MNTDSDIRAQLKEMREGRDLTQRDLAFLVERPQNWVHRVESGTAKLTPEVLDLWCSACRVVARIEFGRGAPRLWQVKEPNIMVPAFVPNEEDQEWLNNLRIPKGPLDLRRANLWLRLGDLLDKVPTSSLELAEGWMDLLERTLLASGIRGRK